MIALKVTQAFGDYSVGDIIEDNDKAKEALRTNPSYVVRFNLEKEEPAQVEGAAPTT